MIQIKNLLLRIMDLKSSRCLTMLESHGSELHNFIIISRSFKKLLSIYKKNEVIGGKLVNIDLRNFTLGLSCFKELAKLYIYILTS